MTSPHGTGDIDNASSHPAHGGVEIAQKQRVWPFGNWRRRNSSSLQALWNAQNARLASGLILFIFAATHFLNHALGLVAVQWMEAVQEVRRGFWRSWPLWVTIRKPCRPVACESHARDLSGVCVEAPMAVC